MNALKNLTEDEYRNLVASVGFTDREQFILRHYRLGDMTLQGMAMDLGISEYEARRVKNLAELKIVRHATKVAES